MESTLIIAKTIGVYFILSGLFVMTNRKTLTLILKDLFKHRAITYVIGVFITIAGTALVLANKVTDPISNFIEIISWMILVKGIFYIFFPEVLKNITKGFSRATYFFLGLTVTVVGIYLVFLL